MASITTKSTTMLNTIKLRIHFTGITAKDAERVAIVGNAIHANATAFVPATIAEIPPKHPQINNAAIIIENLEYSKSFPNILFQNVNCPVPA